ncbi:GEVED domain-containing protein [Flavobacterium sp.]|uniref:GEVED domain-containing protein n=1 Tax=Flavobacterium sp. TaxID=239 RepID=UPI0011FF1026|nr:GEVED domain-containing protein [Flavobacterium sp.]RZJ70207.1 MAG: T9SS type A sorting domain-containing protein [Flavobacterium sp.]
MRKTTLWSLAGLFLSFLANAQNVSGYSFSQATETYSAVAGPASTATGDDGTQNAIPFGFSFPFGGTNYTTFSISTNGFIRLGNDIAATNWVNTLANDAAQRPLIAPFWDDHNVGTGSINYTTTGTTPNRIVHIGWNNINPSGGGGTSTTAFGSFKMRLYETTGVIEFVYGPTITAVGLFSASIGLNDTTNFLSVTPGLPGTTSSATANNNVNSTTNVVGRKYTFTPPTPCSGTPAPGATLAPDLVCPNIDFTVAIGNPTGDLNLVYQWQSSSDGVTFTDIAGADQPFYTTSQTSTTYYRCAVSCGAQTANTSFWMVGMSALSDCYCAPVYTSGMTDGDLISNVAIPGTTLANNTGTTPANPYYTYFTGQPNYTAELQSGGNYQLEITVGTYGGQSSTAWIDYNDDAVFSEEERIGYAAAPIGSLETVSYNISLSCDAPVGLHRMRVRNVWNMESQEIQPCATYGYGEVEDYDITIVGGEACPAPYNLAVSNVNPSSGNATWGAGCGQTSWNVYIVEAGGAAPSANPTYTNVNSGFVFSNLMADTAYDIYVQGNCGANGMSDWAGPIEFSTAPMAVANDDCATAFTLQVGGVFTDYPITATNAGATKTLGEPNVTCATFGFGGDVWFSAVVPASGSLTFETQADSNSNLIDTGMSAYSGTCGGGLTSLGCSDDDGIDGFSLLQLNNLTPGTTVYARVWEYANDTVGTFKVSAYDASLGNAGFHGSALRYYPNPAKDKILVSYENEISEIAVVNNLGQQLLVQKVGATSAQIDLSWLPTGNYFMKVTSGNATQTVKLIKQ